MYKNIEQLYKAPVINVILFRYSYEKTAGSASNRYLLGGKIPSISHLCEQISPLGLLHSISGVRSGRKWALPSGSLGSASWDLSRAHLREGESPVPGSAPALINDNPALIPKKLNKHISKEKFQCQPVPRNHTSTPSILSRNWAISYSSGHANC